MYSNAAYLLAAYALTLPTVFIAGALVPNYDLVAALKFVCLLAFGWHAAVIVQKNRPETGSAAALAASTGLFWAAALVIVLYKAVTLVPFNFTMVMLSLDDVARTLVHVLGDYGVPIAVGALAAMAALASAAAWMLSRALRRVAARLPLGRRGAAACVAVLSFFAAGDLWYALDELVIYRQSWFLIDRPFAPAPLVHDYSAVPVRTGESVFILQLESVTSHALFERRRGEAGLRPRIAQPGLEKILKEGGGVFFPLFWANGIQTHRAWESIMCGVAGNAGTPVTAAPPRLMRATCLPRHLANAGYATLFLYSYFNLDFYNLRGFARVAGFQQIAYDANLMQPGDRRYRWAYDDCVFYRRAFEYLAQHGLGARERLFAYFEVGMNHWPFVNSQKRPEAHPFKAPANPLEHYLNSVAEQDYCLLEFWKQFRALGRDDIHLLILPDHGVNVEGLPADPDTLFATWLAYVPPARRAAEFKPRMVLSPVPSQAQLYPTLLELLGGPASPRSFAFALRGEPVPPQYDDCHLLADEQRLVAWRKSGERAEYRLRSRELQVSGGPGRLSDYQTFRDRYSCR